MTPVQQQQPGNARPRLEAQTSARFPRSRNPSLETKKNAGQVRHFCAQRQGDQNGSFMSLRSLRVSTKTNGPSSITTTGGRSRGTCTGLGSAAIAAWTTAILAGSELTHCRPELLATWIKLSTGKVKACTLGRPVAGAAAGAGAAGTGVATGAETGAIAATAAGASVTGTGVIAAGAGVVTGAASALAAFDHKPVTGAWASVGAGAALVLAAARSK